MQLPCTYIPCPCKGHFEVSENVQPLLRHTHTMQEREVLMRSWSFILNIRVRAPQKSLKLAKDVEMKLHVCYISFVIYKLCSGEEGLVCVSQNATLASFSGVEMALSGFLPVKCCPPRGVVEIVHLVFSRLIIVVREM